MRPKRARQAATSRAGASGSASSAATKCAGVPSRDPQPLGRLSPRVRVAAGEQQPCGAGSRERSRRSPAPTPCVAPVTSATLPSRRTSTRALPRTKFLCWPTREGGRAGRAAPHAALPPAPPKLAPTADFTNPKMEICFAAGHAAARCDAQREGTRKWSTRRQTGHGRPAAAGRHGRRRPQRLHRRRASPGDAARRPDRAGRRRALGRPGQRRGLGGRDRPRARPQLCRLPRHGRTPRRRGRTASRRS